jgi:hypothetical protein
MDDRKLRKVLEDIIRGSQANADHLSGGAREFARKFNLLAQDVDKLYELLGVEIDRGSGSEVPDTSVNISMDHDELEGVSADDHHDEVHNILDAAHGDSDSADAPGDGQVLTYDLTAAKWIADDIPTEAGGRGPRRGWKPPGDFLAWQQDEAANFVAPPGVKGDKGDKGDPGAPAFPAEDPENFGMWIPAGGTSTGSGSVIDHTHSSTGDGGANLYPSGVTEIDGSFSLFDWLSDTLVADQNNYHVVNMDSASGINVVPSGADRNITGLDLTGASGPFSQGTIFGFQNPKGASQNIVLKHESGSSTAANRFYFSDAADLSIGPGGTVLLIYNLGDQRWNLVGVKGSTGATGSAGAAGAAGVPGFIYFEEADTIVFPGPAGPTGATGADGAPGAGGSGGTGMPSGAYYEEADDRFLTMPVQGTDTNTDEWTFTFPYTLTDGQVFPSRVLMAPCRIVSYRAYNDSVRNSAITVDIKKNGVSVFPSATKPDIPAAASTSGTAREPDTQDWAAGDVMTVHLSGSNGNGPVGLFMKVVK